MYIFFDKNLFWEEWPSGLRCYNQNQNVPSSNPTSHAARLRNPTLLQDSIKKLSQFID